jgi:hypothetical protein
VTEVRSVGEHEGDAQPRHAAGRRLPAGSLTLAWVALAVLICGGLLVYGAGRGLDLTDEVFYLIRTRDPAGYQLSYQPFGDLLHPLFQLVGGDLQLYRLTGFAIAAGAGAFVGWSLPGARERRALFALYGAAAALTIFFPWIVTPSYNSVANVGALLILGGVLNLLQGSRPARAVGAAAAGAGLCLAAFGKPPLFAIAVLGLLLMAVAAKPTRAAVCASLAFGAVLVSLIVPPMEIARLVRGIVMSQHVLGLPNTVLGLPGKVVRDWFSVPWPLIAAAIAAGSSLGLRRPREARWLGYAAVALSLGYVASAAQEVIDGDIPDFLGLALTTTAAGYAGVVRLPRQPDRLAIALLLAAPVAVALGTFNNQWFQLNFSLAFPFLALFALGCADPAPWRSGAMQALAVAGPAGVMLLAAFHPYSLPASVFDQQVAVASPITKGSIRVDPQTATFIRSARGLARGDLLIDLSGTGPGVAVVLGAWAPVLPWLNPSVPRWVDVVWSRLSPEQRARASFVVPIWPQFEGTAPARWLGAHRAEFCRTPLPPMTFWGETRTLELWRRCAP